MRNAIIAVAAHLCAFVFFPALAGEVVSSSSGGWFAVDTRMVKDTTLEGKPIVGGKTDIQLMSSSNAWGEEGGGSMASINWQSTSGNGGGIASETVLDSVEWTPEVWAGTNTLTFVSGTVVKTARFKVGSLLPGMVQDVIKDAIDGVGEVVLDGEGWKIAITNDEAGTIVFPDNLGPIVVELDGHDLIGSNGEPAIRVVHVDGDGEPTQVNVVNSVETGGTVAGGDGVPAVVVAEDAREGAGVNIGGGAGIAKVEIDPPEIVPIVYDGMEHTFADPGDALWSVDSAASGTDVGEYALKLQLRDVDSYRWRGHDDAVISTTWTIAQATNEWTVVPSVVGGTYGGPAPQPTAGAKFGEWTVDYSAMPDMPGDYVATFTVDGTGNYTGLSVLVPFTIAPDARQREVLGALGGLGAITGDGDGWKVVVTNDVTGTIELSDGLGPVKIDLGGWNLSCPDAGPAIRIVHEDGDGDPTVISIVNSGDTGGAVAGGDGAPAVVVAQNAREGAGVDIGDGAAIVKIELDKPELKPLVYNGEAQTFADPGNPLWTVSSAASGTDVGEYGLSLQLRDVMNYKWRGTEDAVVSTVFRIVLRDCAKTVVGEYCAFNLQQELGVEIDADYLAGDKVVVKVETLPKGLKLVSEQISAEVYGKKALTNILWRIEGVPTETVDFASRPMFARVTVVRGKEKVETLQRIMLDISAADTREFPAGILNADYATLKITDIWPEADASWTFKGWPAGIKYTANGIKETKTTPAYDALSVYGKPAKAGRYAVTATIKKAVGRSTVNETRTALFTVWADSLEREFRFSNQAYTAVLANLGDEVAAVSGLPGGLKFTAKDVAASRTSPAYRAGDVYGVPNKPGVYVVQLARQDKTKSTFLWEITEGENPGLGAQEIGWNGGKVKFSAAETKAAILQGTALELELDNARLAENAKVTVSGLPSGFKYDAKYGKITGVATKVESKVVTVKVVQNGVAIEKRFAVVVSPNPFAGTYYAFFRGNGDDLPDCHVATAVITPAAGGTSKIVFEEYVPSVGKTIKYTLNDPRGFTMTEEYDPDHPEDVKVNYTYALKADAGNNPDFGRVARTMRLDLSTLMHECGIVEKRGTLIVGTAKDRGTSTWLFHADVAKSMTIAEFGELKSADRLVGVSPLLTENFVACGESDDLLETNHFGYVVEIFDEKKVQYQVKGRLADGTTVNLTAPLTWDILWMEEKGWEFVYGAWSAPFFVQEKKGEKRVLWGAVRSEDGLRLFDAAGWFPLARDAQYWNKMPGTATELLGWRGRFAIDAGEWIAAGFEGDAPEFNLVVNGPDLSKAKIDVQALDAMLDGKPLASISSTKLQSSSGYVFKGSFKWDEKVGGDGRAYAFELVPMKYDFATPPANLRFSGRCEVKSTKGNAAVLTARIMAVE